VWLTLFLTFLTLFYGLADVGSSSDPQRFFVDVNSSALVAEWLDLADAVIETVSL